MTNEATLEKMKVMRLHGMTRAFRQTLEAGFRDKFTLDELVAHLVDSEYEEQYNRRLV